MNSRELRLALILAAALVGAGGWIVFRQMLTWKTNIERKEREVALNSAAAKELMKQKDFWTTRSEWLTEKLPAYPGRSSADNALYEMIEDTARKASVTLLGRQQQQPESRPGAVGTGIMVEAKGSMEHVLRWVHSLQSPEAFISVRGMSLKPDPEDTSVVMLKDFHVLKWYREDATADATKSTGAQ